jgi:DNA (cytosine-5)-methyltransferase 1
VGVGEGIDYRECRFRMLEAHEVQRAMAFTDDYEITGTKKEKVKQSGNAVTPPVMEALVSRAIQSLQ